MSGLSIEERDGALVVVARVQPITPELRAELAFGPGGDRYRAILDQMQDGCCVVDLRGNYLFVNDAFCRLYGFEKSEILGWNYRESAAPEREGLLREMYTQVYRTGQPIRAFEYAIGPKHGPVVFVEQSVSLERDAQGRPVGFLVITRDCTERKRVQEELAKARDAAEAANRAKSEFLANMSHEIRTPMNGIIGMTALALDSAPTPAQADFLATIRSQANSLLTIVNDILDFSKIESHRLELESVPFTLGHALDEVVKPLALRAEERGIVALGPDRAGRACARGRRPGSREAGPDQRPQQRRQVHRARLRHARGRGGRAERRSRGRRRHDSADLPRHGHRHRDSRRQAGDDLRAVPSGGRLDVAPVRRDRPGPRHCDDPREVDGRARSRSTASRVPAARFRSRCR